MPDAALTSRGAKLFQDYAVRNVTVPTNYYVALVTADTVPDEDTTTLGGLTEINAGNGYTAGGFQLTPGTTDFDVQTVVTTPNRYVEVQIKDVTWTASGGNIPASGTAPSYAVLTTDEGTVADRQVIAYAKLTSAPVTVASGLTLTLIDFFVRIGGNLSLLPDDSESSGEKTILSDTTQDSWGAWVEMIASTAKATRHLIVTVTSLLTNPRTGFQIGVGAATSEVVKVGEFVFDYNSSNDSLAASLEFPFDIPAGSRIAIRSRNKEDTVQCDHDAALVALQK